MDTMKIMFGLNLLVILGCLCKVFTVTASSNGYMYNDGEYSPNYYANYAYGSSQYSIGNDRYDPYSRGNGRSTYNGRYDPYYRNYAYVHPQRHHYHHKKKATVTTTQATSITTAATCNTSIWIDPSGVFSNCGRPPIEPQPSVDLPADGGNPPAAPLESHPWSCLILDAADTPQCECVFISSQFVLTSSVCVATITTSFTVGYGDGIATTPYTGPKANILTTIPHPQSADTPDYTYTIELVKLVEPVPDMIPICLATTPLNLDAPYNRPNALIGSYFQRTDGKYSYLNSIVYDGEQCPNMDETEQNRKTNICGWPDNKCQVDHYTTYPGGSLIAKRCDGTWAVYGISPNTDYTCTGSSDLMVDITKVYAWILQKARTN